ncbi:hypothetical protein RQP46_008133 [Phenoliferia psychrophenolica]
MVNEMNATSESSFACFGCGKSEPVKKDWKQHKQTCQTLVKGQNEFETKLMAAPSNGVVYAAADVFIHSPLFEEIATYLSRALYRFGDPGPRLEKTHIVFLDFTFHPDRSERNLRRAQFELADGGIIPFQKMGELAYTTEQTGEIARERREFISRLKNGVSTNVPKDHMLGAVVALINTKDLSTVPQVLTFRSYYKPGMSIPKGHTDGWLPFAKKAFSKGPIPHDWTEVGFSVLSVLSF